MEVELVGQSNFVSRRQGARTRTLDLVLAIVLGGWLLASLAFSLSSSNFEEFLPIKTIRNVVGALIFQDNSDDSWAPMFDAIIAFRNGAHDLYSVIFFHDGIKFQYPITSLVLVEPFLYLPRSLAVHILNIINCIGYLISILLFIVIAGFFRTNFPKKRILATGLSVSLFFPLEFALRLGQIQMWIDLFAILAVVLWLHRLQFLSGICVGFCIIIKPQLAILIVWGLIVRELTFVGGIVLITSSFSIIAVAVFGLNNLIGYLSVLSFLSRHPESYYGNNSLAGIVLRWLHVGPNLVWDAHNFPPANGWAIGISTTFGILLVCGTLLHAWWYRRGHADDCDLAAMLLVATLASPIAWEHHFGLALPLIAVLVRTLFDAPVRYLQVGLLTLAWLLLGVDPRFTNGLSDTVLNPLQATMFFGACLILVVYFGHRHNVASRPA